MDIFLVFVSFVMLCLGMALQKNKDTILLNTYPVFYVWIPVLWLVVWILAFVRLLA